jgi:adenosylhomocysteine nucleosidase
MLTIVTGLSEEADVARSVASPDVLILCGQAQRDDLAHLVPPNCTTIMKFGLCGGISPELATIGQIVLADNLTDGAGGIYHPDPVWLHRIFGCTKAYERHWYSSGLYNTADTPAQRAALFKATGCAAIDDEGLAVAKFAAARNISFAVVGSISDTFADSVPRAAYNATNPDGSSNVGSIINYLIAHPCEDPEEIWDLGQLAVDFNTSINELRTCAIQLGPLFQSS